MKVMESKLANVYHSLLRVGVVVVASLLLFDSGILFPVTEQLSQNAQYYVANVIGVGAAVEPTELNTLTAEISARQRDLDAREAALNEREINVDLNSLTDLESTSLSTYILSVLLFIILVLIVLNYALDSARERYVRQLERQINKEKATT